MRRKVDFSLLLIQRNAPSRTRVYNDSHGASARASAVLKASQEMDAVLIRHEIKRCSTLAERLREAAVEGIWTEQGNKNKNKLRGP
jgi:hypothetical protein